MIAFGWICLALIGAYIVFVIAFWAAHLVFRGGLEAIPPMLACGIATALLWIGIVAWVSPYSITVDESRGGYGE